MHESSDKMVNHPDHYKGAMGVETMDFIHEICRNIYIGGEISEWTNYEQYILVFDLGQVIKYICRYERKNGAQDIDKAIWYMQDFMDIAWKVENKELPNPKNISYNNINDTVEEYIRSAEGKTVSLWLNALVGPQPENPLSEYMLRRDILALCWILSEDCRALRPAVSIQYMLRCLHINVRERERENAETRN